MRHLAIRSAALLVLITAVTTAIAQTIVPDSTVVRHYTTYYGADVQIGARGDAALLFGEVRVGYHDRVSRIPLDPLFIDAYPGAPEYAVDAADGIGASTGDSMHPGAPETAEGSGTAGMHPGARERSPLGHLRTMPFPLPTGTVVSAAIRLNADTQSLARIAAGTAHVHYTVALVDAFSGEVIGVLFTAALGAGEVMPRLPEAAPSLAYNGPSVAAAVLKMTVDVIDAGTDAIGVEGLVVYAQDAPEPVLGKKSATVIAPAMLSIAPNPATNYALAEIIVPREGMLRIAISDMVGRVASITSLYANVTHQTVAIPAQTLAAGIYRVTAYLNDEVIGAGTCAVVK